ncbi:MAG TPA: hypothetical protein VF891_07555 [Gaiellaceae bacterium]
MKRALFVACVVALFAAAPASAAIFLRLTATTIHRGGLLHLAGNPEAMPLYALPLARVPRCMRDGGCAELMRRSNPPTRPFVFIGRTPGSSPGFAVVRAFTIRVPRELARGRYKLFVWCRPCGGSLIPVGTNAFGQTLRIVQ